MRLLARTQKCLRIKKIRIRAAQNHPSGTAKNIRMTDIVLYITYSSIVCKLQLFSSAIRMLFFVPYTYLFCAAEMQIFLFVRTSECVACVVIVSPTHSAGSECVACTRKTPIVIFKHENRREVPCRVMIQETKKTDFFRSKLFGYNVIF